MCSVSDSHTPNRPLGERFWDMHEANGAGMAMLLLASEFDFNNKGVKDAIPYIMKEAGKRGISMTQFLQEFEDATRVNNDGGGISLIGGDEDHRDEDADEPSPQRDADGEDQAGRRDDTEGEGV